jgi:integrase
LAVAVVADLRSRRAPASAEELERFETDLLAGLVLARSAAGLTDATIRGELGHLDQLREWFGRPLWEMEPADADAYFGRVLRGAPKGTRLAKAAALSVYFEFVELRHKAELHAMTGRVAECPIDEMNRPRGGKDARLRVPPLRAEIEALFTGWAQELATCRKFASSARNYTAALMADTGVRVNEARHLGLDDIRWELGHLGKLHVQMGKGARGSGPRQRMVPLLNGAGRTLRWYVEDVWGQFGDDHTRHGAPLFPSERISADGTRPPVGYDRLRAALATATAAHLPAWKDRMSPHVLRHYCASQLYLSGVDLISIQEMYGLGGHHAALRSRPPQPDRGRLARWPAARRRPAGRTGLSAVEPAPGRGSPRHLEGLGAAAPARRAGPGDLGGQDVGAVVGPADLGQAR